MDGAELEAPGSSPRTRIRYPHATPVATENFIKPIRFLNSRAAVLMEADAGAAIMLDDARKRFVSLIFVNSLQLSGGTFPVRVVEVR